MGKMRRTAKPSPFFRGGPGLRRLVAAMDQTARMREVRGRRTGTNAPTDRITVESAAANLPLPIGTIGPDVGGEGGSPPEGCLQPPPLSSGIDWSAIELVPPSAGVGPGDGRSRLETSLMRSRLATCLLALMLLGHAGTAPARGEEPIFLRGHRVTPQHIVFGMIDGIHGNSAQLNLGSAHGVKPGLTLLVVRKVHEEIMPVGGLFITAAAEDHSRGRVEGPFRPQINDFVLIHASRLDLWGGAPRLERLAQNRLALRQLSNTYNTLDTSPQLMDEVARDDDFQARQYQYHREGEFVAEASRKIGPLKSRLGAVAPQPQLRPGPEEENGRGPAAAAEDVTLDSLSRFADLARNADLLRKRMTLERLQRLRPVDPTAEVSEANAALYREILAAWTSKALSRDGAAGALRVP